MIISQWNPTFVLDDTLDMEAVRRAMAGKTLHVSFCCVQPPSFQQWSQVTNNLNTMTTYRSDIRTYTPDEAVTSSRRAAAVKDDATIQRRRVEQAMASPDDQSIFIVKLLQEDLQALYVEISSTCQSGVVWNAENFGVQREELQQWRQYSLTLYQTLSETKKRTDLEASKILEAYQSNVKLKKLPMISRATWTDWLTRWRLELKYIPAEWSRFWMVQTSLSDPDDVAQCKKLTTSDQLLGYLSNKYGAMDRLIPSLVMELQKLKKPKNRKDQTFMLNLSKISTTLVTIYAESAQARLECLVIELIVKQAFPEEVLVLYNNMYYDCINP